MRLWLVQPRDDETEQVVYGDGTVGQNPWVPPYDKMFGFVIRAETEAAARQIASQHSMDEASSDFDPWLDPQLATCIELTAEGETGVILSKFAAA